MRGKTKHFILAGAHVCEATIFFGHYAIKWKALPSRTRGLARIMCEGARTLGGAWGGGSPRVYVTLTVEGEMQVGDTSRPFCLCCSVFGFV